MSGALRRFLKLPVTLPLRIGFIRRRVAYELRRWFAEFEFEIPLGEGLACPIGHWDSVHSFSEIFVTDEYGNYLDAMPLPRRWLDLGCHAGYFTLHLAWKNALAGRGKDWRALMIDADPRMAPLASWVLRRNGLEGNGTFKQGMIGAGSGEREFALRPGMGSSSTMTGAPVEAVCRVPCITAEEIAKAFPPPYDLIKLDIEGAEFDFIGNYPGLCREAEYLLMEWHSPDREGKREPELRKLCEEAGFEYVKDVRAIRSLCVDEGWASSGVQLYRRRRP